MPDKKPAERPGALTTNAAARDASQRRVAEAIANATTLQEKQDATRLAAFYICQDLLQSLDPISEAVLPNRSKSAETASDGYSRVSNDSHLKVLSPEVAMILEGYRDLSFERVRCYVRRGATGKVANYDIMVPRWRGIRLYDPSMSWAGPENRWLGSRPSTGPTDVHVIGRADNGNIPFPVRTAEEIPDTCAYRAFGGVDRFKWAKDDPRFETRAQTADINTVTTFIRQTKDLLTQVQGALTEEVDELDNVLDIAAGKHLLQLDAGPGDDADQAPPAAAAPVQTSKPGKAAPPTPRAGGSVVDL